MYHGADARRYTEQSNPHTHLHSLPFVTHCPHSDAGEIGEMLRLVRGSDSAPMPVRNTRPSDVPPCNPERDIRSEPAAGGLTLYTFLDYRGNPIGYAEIAIAPVDDVVPRQVVELYDLCAAEAAAASLRMG